MVQCSDDGGKQAVKKGIRSFEAERLKIRANKAKEALDIKVQKNLIVLILGIRFVVEPEN